MKVKVTRVSKTDLELHRSELMVHTEDGNILCEFSKMEQFERWCKLVGVELSLPRPKYHKGVLYYTYEFKQEFFEYEFTNLKEIPHEAVKCKGLSYGNIVTCYVWVTGSKTIIYRPNSFFKDIFQPLSAEEHVKFIEENGTLNVEQLVPPKYGFTDKPPVKKPVKVESSSVKPKNLIQDDGDFIIDNEDDLFEGLD
ncbi:hypothetical protein COF68_05155 [Bacillus toyonensis]|uniref:hypothetical protein n=1 Tax=Bacillus toyonensis TaxID=155322 RepID=UPI000BFE7DD2|nr:hypothetical protein [Bacillus toyonensis]PHE64233.1 hypothetical protein COF68_05155 [Bacillus toyonensis]